MSIGSKLRLARLRTLPWAVVARTIMALARRWRSLSRTERSSLARLVRASGGRPGRLSAKERRELVRLVGKLELKRLGLEMLPIARRGRGRRRGRRFPRP